MDKYFFNLNYFLQPMICISFQPSNQNHHPPKIEFKDGTSESAFLPSPQRPFLLLPVLGGCLLSAVTDAPRQLQWPVIAQTRCLPRLTNPSVCQ